LILFFLAITSSPINIPDKDVSAVAARPVFSAARRLISGKLILTLRIIQNEQKIAFPLYSLPREPRTAVSDGAQESSRRFPSCPILKICNLQAGNGKNAG
jgi:hypothetical protein